MTNVPPTDNSPGAHSDDALVRAMGTPVEGAPRAMLNQALRYARPIAFLDRLGAGGVLDVGSGASGLASWWPHPVTGVDLRFDGVPPPNLTTVTGSILNLPFADRSHDAVVCTDVFEHLPADSRAPALAELLRVSSRLVWVSFPCGPSAERADRLIGSIAAHLGPGVPGWLEDHLELGLPRRDDALGWSAPGFRRGWAMSLPVPAHVAVILAEHAPGGRAVDRLAHRAALLRSLTARPSRSNARYRLEMWFKRTDAP